MATRELELWFPSGGLEVPPGSIPLFNLAYGDSILATSEIWVTDDGRVEIDLQEELMINGSDVFRLLVLFVSWPERKQMCPLSQELEHMSLETESVCRK